MDTTVWVDYLKGTSSAAAGWLDVEMDRQRIGLTDLILHEVLRGVRGEREAKRLHRELRRFEVFETGGEALAVEAARLYRFLRTRGRTVRRTVDCIIATFCLTRGYALLHNDRDFDPFEDELRLRVVHP